MNEVKRYAIISDDWDYVESPSGGFVDHDDYAALEAECARLKNALLSITARHFAEGWKKRTSDAELEQYLSAGIAQLEAERDALAAELAAIKGQQPVAFYWQDIGYPEPSKHGPYFGWPSESALRNVDGGAIPVPLYTLPPTSHDQEGT